MKKKRDTCKNCEEQFNVNFKFCPHCGQQAKDELTIKVLFYNTISNYFSFDARFFKSFLPLLFKPGYIASKFIEGKRLLFLHPAQMYLFVAVVFFFLFSFVQRDQVRSLDNELAKTLKVNDIKSVESAFQKKDSIEYFQSKKDSLEKVKLKKLITQYNINNDISEKEIDSLLGRGNLKNNSLLDFDYNQDLDSLIKIGAPQETIYKSLGMSNNAGFFERRIYAQALKLYKSRRGGSMLQAFYDAIPIAMFFLLPIFALILKVLNFKKGLYAHHVVFSFYYFSFLFVVFSLILVVNFVWDLPFWIDGLVMLSTFFYLFLAIKYFYKQSWLKSLLKSTVASFSFLLFVIPLAVFILGVFAFLSY